MLRQFLRCCIFAGVVAITANASLVHRPDITVLGSGLGAVNTIVTVHDQEGQTEGGCIGRAGGVDVTTPCFAGITQHDNSAINQTLSFADINFQAGQNVGTVVNISETGQDQTVTITNLYLAFWNGNTLVHTATYTPPAGGLNVTSGTGTGIGGSGFVFALTPAELTIVIGGCGPTGANCRIGGGVQFGTGTTNDGQETMYVVAVAGQQVPPPIPEPSTMALLGSGLIGVALWRRRRSA